MFNAQKYEDFLTSVIENLVLCTRANGCVDSSQVVFSSLLNVQDKDFFPLGIFNEQILFKYSFVRQIIYILIHPRFTSYRVF